MVESDELVMLLIGFGVLVFLFKNRLKPPDIPAYNVLASSFYVLFVGLLATVLEGFWLNTYFNYLEHICYAVSSVLLALWCQRLSVKRKG